MTILMANNSRLKYRSQMRIKLFVAAILGSLLFAGIAQGADVPDEQFDGSSALMKQYPSTSGDKYLGAWFTDSGWRAIQSPSYLDNWDAPVSTPLCKSVSECFDRQLNMVAMLPFCHDQKETNCIETVEATDSKGRKIGFTNQRYFPKSQETVFQGSPASMAPNGSTASVVQFPGLYNGAGTPDYAIGVSVGRTFTPKSDGGGSYGDPRFVASISPVKLITGNYRPREAIKTSNGFDIQALDHSGECTVLEVGICGTPTSFPKDVSFTLTLKINQLLYGWLHGRLLDAKITNTALSGNSYRVEISGKPSQVPDVIAAAQADKVPDELVKSAFGSGVNIGNMRSDSFPLIATYAPVRGTYTYNGFISWAPYMQDKAAAMPQVWSVRAIQKDQVVASAGGDALKCLVAGSMNSSNNGIVGFLNTNATSYMSGPPTFNSAEGVLEYKVAAPHFAKDGTLFAGNYTLQIREDVARCIFNLTNAPVQATISITSSDGSPQTVATNMRQANGFFYFQASGFHFSAPVIKVKLANSSSVPTPVVVVPTAKPTTVAAKPTSKPLPSIKCVKGKLVHITHGVNAKCPAGYKKV